MKNKTISLLLCLLLTSCASKAPITEEKNSYSQSDEERYRVPDKKSPYTEQVKNYTSSLPQVIDVNQTQQPVSQKTTYRPRANDNTASISNYSAPFSTTSPVYSPSLSIPRNTDKQTSAGNPSSYNLLGKQYKVLPFSNGFVEKGVASWYGPDFHGKKTSNGEIYNMYGMTAAHKRLPIPSYVRVTNLKNGRQVVLRINDRGPFHDDRVIDLSYAAAQKLDIHEVGTEWVQIEAIDTPQGKNHDSVYLQLGVFNDPKNAQRLQAKVAANSMPQPRIKQVYHEGRVVYKVQLGPLFSTEKVDEFNMKLARIGVDKTRYVTERRN